MNFERDLPRRRPIVCPWSSSLFLLKVLCTVEISPYVFRGVLAEIVDEDGWPSPPPRLLWVLDTGTSLQLWHDIQQRPPIRDPVYKMIKNVIAHYENADGDVHYAVNWEGYLCPVWVPDDALPCHELISDYWRRTMECI